MDKTGKIVLNLPPSKGNARNSEGAFYTFPDGNIIYVYTKFISDNRSDFGKACLVLRSSNDDGETWSGDKILFEPEEHNAINIMSVSFLEMKNGDVGIFYAIKSVLEDCRLYLRRSSDNGETWDKGHYCINEFGYYVTNNDRVIRLESGRILIPYNKHAWINPEKRVYIPGISYSDDDGITFKNIEICTDINMPNSRSGFQESGIIELKGRRLYQWMRTDMGRQYESYSYDDGLTWDYPVPSCFTSPCSPLSMRREPVSGKLVAVYNPIPNYNYRKSRRTQMDRTPLILVTSEDEGKTWSEALVLEDDPNRGFCYCAIHFVKDYVLLSYCAGGEEDGSCLVRSVIRKIPLDSFI